MTAAATEHEPANRRDVEGPSRGELETQARRMTVSLRGLYRIRTRFERRLHVLELLHTDPDLLVETVLVLTEPDARR